jgi:hypothetical protein
MSLEGRRRVVLRAGRRRWRPRCQRGGTILHRGSHGSADGTTALSYNRGRLVPLCVRAGSPALPGAVAARKAIVARNDLCST